jgi:hypothetical protein
MGSNPRLLNPKHIPDLADFTAKPVIFLVAGATAFAKIAD